MPPIDRHVQGRNSRNPTEVDASPPADRSGPGADALQPPGSHRPQGQSRVGEDAFLARQPSSPRAASQGATPATPQPPRGRSPGEGVGNGGSAIPASLRPAVRTAERGANGGGPPQVHSELYRRVRDRTRQVVRVFARRGQGGDATHSSARIVSVRALWARYRSYRAVVVAREQVLLNSSGQLSLRRVQNFVRGQMWYLNIHPTMDTLRGLEAMASAIRDWHASSGRQPAATGAEAEAFGLLDEHLTGLRGLFGPAQPAAASSGAAKDQFKTWDYVSLDERPAPKLDPDTMCVLSLMTLDDPDLEPVYFKRGDVTAFADFKALKEWFNLHGACDPIAAGGAAPLDMGTLYRPGQAKA